MATGHIRKRIDSTGKTSYQITVEGDRDPVSGKRNRHYETVHGTKKQAEAIMRRMIQDMESGGLSVPSSMTVSSWVTEWLENFRPNIEATTRDGYQEKIKNYITPYFGRIPLKDLKTEYIQQWVNSLQAQGLTAKTIRNAYNVLNPALKKAVVMRKIPYNPSDGVELPKLVRPDVDVYDPELCKRAVKAAEGTDMYLIVLLEVTVGLRRGELIALRWPNVDLDAGVIHICENTVRANGGTITKEPKSKAGNRNITIGAEVIKALREAREEYDADRKALGKGFHDDGYVIRQKNGEQFKPDSITQKWRRFETQNGLPHIKFHGLRHSNATALIQAGVNPKVVQQRLGHADVSITLNTYTHVTAHMDQEAATKLDDMFFSSSDGT